MNYLNKNTAISTNLEEIRIKLTDEDANQHPYLYLTGHGNINFSDDEVIALRSILMNNGFLHADDNYGMDDSFRREIKRVFPNKDLVPLPYTHRLFHSYYNSEKFKIEDINLMNSRMFLLKGIKQVIFNGLEILGVDSPEEM